MAVLRHANAAAGGTEIPSIPAAAAVLKAEDLRAIARRVGVFAFFQGNSRLSVAPERVGFHALVTRQAVEAVARETGSTGVDELRAIALLHDVGKVVLAEAVPGYPEEIHGGARAPADMLAREREELGTDHAEVGARLARHQRLPESLAAGIAEHHDPGASGPGALVGLADALAHYQHGDPVDPGSAFAAGTAFGLGHEGLGRLMYELTYPLPGEMEPVEPCPLSPREVDVLRGIAEGKVSKQIASELDVAVSTVRNHLHRAYGKLGAADRAQAVLTASSQGWL